jgi:hypothetical protein
LFLPDGIVVGMFYFTKLDAVAFLTRLAGNLPVKNPNGKFPRLTWTALDVGGPCVETLGMISENSSPL